MFTHRAVMLFVLGAGLGWAQFISGIGTTTNPASPAPGSNGLQSWASTTWTPRTLQAGTGVVITNGNASGGDPIIALNMGMVVTGAQVQTGGYVYAVGSGTASAQTATLTPTLLSYAAGMVVWFKPSITNTGALTLDLGPGPVSVLTAGGATLTAGAVVGGQLYGVWYDGAAFRLIVASTFAAEAIVSGTLSLARLPTSGGGTIIPTTNGLTNSRVVYVDGSGRLASMSGTVTDCVLVNGTSAPCQAISLSTTGTSGAATLVGNVLNIPQYGGTTFTSQAANLFLATPNGASGVPSMRQIVAEDVPVLDFTAKTSGLVPLTRLAACAEGQIPKIVSGTWTCAVDGGGGGGSGITAPYPYTLTAVTGVVTIPAASHGFTTRDLDVKVFDAANVEVDVLTEIEADFDVKLTFAASFTGRALIAPFGGGTASPALTFTRTSSTVMTYTAGTATVNGAYTLLAGGTITVSSGAGGPHSVLVYVTSAGVMTVKTVPGVTITCSACTIATPEAVPALPVNAIPVAALTVTAGAWDTTIVRQVSTLQSSAIVPGSGLAEGAAVGGARVLQVDSAAVMTQGGTNVVTGSLSATGATSTAPNKSGLIAARPGTCTVGQTYFATDVTAGQNLSACTSTNTWTTLAGAGGGVAPSTLAGLPGTCTVGDLRYVTDAAPPQIYHCYATNTYGPTQPTADAGASLTPIIVNGRVTFKITDNTVPDLTLSNLSSASAARTNLGLAPIAATGSASDLSAGTVPTARLGSGTANSTTFLRGDNTWAAPAGGSPGGSTGQLQANIAGAFAGLVSSLVNNPGASNESITFVQNALTTTTTPEIFVENTTAATAGVTVQNGPGFVSLGRVWASGSTTSVLAGAYFGSYVQTSSTGLGHGFIRSVLGGTSTSPTLSSSGFFFNAANGVFGYATAPQNAGLSFSAGGVGWRNASAVSTFFAGDNGGIASSSSRIGHAAGALGSTPACDTCFSRNAARVFELDNGTAGLGNRGDLILRSLVMATSEARPTCDSTQRGKLYTTQGGTGVADTVAVCAKDAADAYAWRTIY